MYPSSVRMCYFSRQQRMHIFSGNILENVRIIVYPIQYKNVLQVSLLNTLGVQQQCSLNFTNHIMDAQHIACIYIMHPWHWFLWLWYCTSCKSMFTIFKGHFFLLLLVGFFVCLFPVLKLFVHILYTKGHFSIHMLGSLNTGHRTHHCSIVVVVCWENRKDSGQHFQCCKC